VGADFHRKTPPKERRKLLKSKAQKTQTPSAKHIMMMVKK